MSSLTTRPPMLHFKVSEAQNTLGYLLHEGISMATVSVPLLGRDCARQEEVRTAFQQWGKRNRRRAPAAHPPFLRLLLIFSTHPPFNFPWRNASTTLGRLSPTGDHLTPRLYTTTLFIRTESAVSQGPGKLGCEGERLTHASSAGLPNADVPLERLSRSQTQSSLAHSIVCHQSTGQANDKRACASNFGTSSFLDVEVRDDALASGVRLQYMAPTDVAFAHHVAI